MPATNPARHRRAGSVFSTVGMRVRPARPSSYAVSDQVAAAAASALRPARLVAGVALAAVLLAAVELRSVGLAAALGPRAATALAAVGLGQQVLPPVLLQPMLHRRSQHRPCRPAVLAHRFAPLGRPAPPVPALLRAASLAAAALLVAEFGAALLQSLLQLLQPLLRGLEARLQFGLGPLLAAPGPFALLGWHEAEEESENEQQVLHDLVPCVGRSPTTANRRSRPRWT